MEINFLRHTLAHQRRQKQVYYAGFLLFIAVLLIIFLPSTLFFDVGLAIIIGLLFAAFLTRLEYGFYLLAFFSFFTGWEIILSKYQWAGNITMLSSLNAPLTDFIAAILLFSFIISRFFLAGKTDWQIIKYARGIIILCLLFGLSGVISAYFSSQQTFGSSAHTLLRKEIFVLAAYLLLPIFIVKNKKILNNIFQIWFWVGVAVALFGLSSLIVLSANQWVRVTPYAIGNFAPLGVNHNELAEALAAIIPVAIYLLYKSRAAGSSRENKVYFIGASLMILALLLTLSRAGWIALAVETVLFAWFYRNELRHYLSEKKNFLLAPMIVLGSAIMIYMIIFLGSKVVSSSTESRWRATQIVMFYAQKAPLLGYGPGAYIPMLADTYDFVIDYGYPPDAHGFIQKILLEHGAAGLIIFAILLLNILWLLWRRQAEADDWQAKFNFRVFLIMAVGAIAFQLFNTSYYNATMWLPIGLALAATRMRAI